MFPLSARDAYEAVLPLMVTSSFLNRASDIWPVPDARWQSLQWHCPIPTGSPLIEQETAPHRHRPATCTLGISASGAGVTAASVGHANQQSSGQALASPGYEGGATIDRARASSGFSASLIENE